MLIGGAFGSEEDARKVKAFLDPYLGNSLDEVRKLQEKLPTDSLALLREWRALLIEVERILEPGTTMRLLLNCRGS